MIYTENPAIDRNNILRYIDDFFDANEMESVQVDTPEVYQVCVRMRSRFPHVDGISKASVFKKIANFVAHFLEIKPIKTLYPGNTIDGLSSYDINAVIALDIAVTCLHNSTIKQANGDVKTIKNPIYISNHSYADIIEALSFDHINQEMHYHLLAVFFEQITYKTNRDCEYKDIDDDDVKPDDGGDGGVKSSAYYSCLLPGGDDCYGV